MRLLAKPETESPDGDWWWDTKIVEEIKEAVEPEK